MLLLSEWYVDNNMLLKILLTISCVIVGSHQTPTVTIKNGSITGIELSSHKGKRFNAYLGIPYAKPPVGPLRFKVTLKTQFQYSFITVNFRIQFQLNYQEPTMLTKILMCVSNGMITLMTRLFLGKRIAYI